MAYVNHLNFADEKGKVFCVKNRRIVVLDDYQIEICMRCPLFRGTNQGRGVECYWDDPRVKKGQGSIWSVNEPYMEQEYALSAIHNSKKSFKKWEEKI